MNISGLSVATNYAAVQSSKLTQLSSGLVIKQASQGSTVQGTAVHSSGKSVAPGTDISGIGTLKNIDEAARQGYREDYSTWDAADSLWRQETQTFNLKDMDDPEKSKEFLENWRIQARWDLGIQSGGPTKDEVISDYIQGLRQNGLSGDINWSGLSKEFSSFKATAPEELEDCLNYMASRYVAALDKLERNFTGEELTAQRDKLEEIYQAGKAGMIDGYTKLLQDNLGISSGDAQAIKNSFSAILEEKADAYRGALEKVHENVSQVGPDSVWLKNHDAYIASQLRVSGATGQSETRYSVQDLTAAGQIARTYQAELFNVSSCGRNEATLALNLSMADMKAETMIQKGLVSQDMAALLRNSRAQGHENALAALDQALSKRENNLAPGEPKGTFAPVNRNVFQGIYNTVMNTYRQNGGDGAGAIRAGAAHGQTVTAQATVKNPNALRWGISIESYWKDFYIDPDDKEVSPLAKQMNRLLVQAGQISDLGCSTYQKYINSWQNFLTSIGSGVDVRA